MASNDKALNEAIKDISISQNWQSKQAKTGECNNSKKDYEGYVNLHKKRNMNNMEKVKESDNSLGVSKK